MENEAQNQQPISSTPLTFQHVITIIKKNKKLVIAITCIALLILSSIFMALLYSRKTKSLENDKTQKSQQKVLGSVIFEPVSSIAVPGQIYSSDVILNTGGMKISGVTLSVKYNPNIMDQVMLIPYQDKYSALAYSMEPMGPPTTDSQNGSTSLTLKLSDGIKDLSGIGKVAELQYKVKKINVAVTSTTISLTPSTVFLSSNEKPTTNLIKN